MKTHLKYILLILIITSCRTTKNWYSDQNDKSYTASYDDFNGKEKIELKRNLNQIAYLSYLTINNKGNLNLDVNRKGFHYIPNKIEHLKFDLNNPLIIQIKGEDAKGKFNLEYPTYKRKEIQVQYNSNFELLSLAYFLSNMYSGLKESNNTFDYNGSKVKVADLFSLNLKIGDRFKTYQNSENLKILKDFFKKHWYLDYTKFVINLSNFPNAKHKQGDSFLHTLFDSKKDEEQFILALNNFYNEIKFDEFLLEYKPYYNKMIEEVKNNLPDENFITEMEHLYNKEASEYFLNASLTMPFSQGYAVSENDNIGYVFGSFTLPSEIDDLNNLSLGYANALQLRNISVHEFGHSFVNPVVDKVGDSIINNKEFLFEPIKKKMSEQAYSKWKYTLYEHFVRAGEIFIAKQLNDEITAQKLSHDYIENREFIYLRQIIPAMEKWYNKKYFTHTYSDFVKETIENLKLEK
ncbi:DUF4932 domain-containing protein [Gillisia sp. Hel_I_29]|uniref:DUF4932 domain-containing protein n=1 Tax=Gillisia sp. Hel_I_29 TaxID=1249975 RepID=UPI00054EF999|nr:DUF4932 domain-containing protein [Gillisia sp. Hel_I_29]